MPTEPLRRVLEAADAVDRAIDEDVSGEELAALRRRLDESFAVVLDVLVGEEHASYRQALVEQYVRLTASLDAFERRSA